MIKLYKPDQLLRLFFDTTKLSVNPFANLHLLLLDLLLSSPESRHSYPQHHFAFLRHLDGGGSAVGLQIREERWCFHGLRTTAKGRI